MPGVPIRDSTPGSLIAGTQRAAAKGGQADAEVSSETTNASKKHQPVGQDVNDVSLDAGDSTQQRDADGRQILQRQPDDQQADEQQTKNQKTSDQDEPAPGHSPQDETNDSEMNASKSGIDFLA
ncbi:MAG: hypothetical protein AAFP90_01990 [Planctomycetota bacterium]